MISSDLYFILQMMKGEQRPLEDIISEFTFTTGRWEGDAYRNKGTSYGYGRVSTKEQKLDRQIEQFLILPIKEENIYVDKENGSNFNRKYYKKLLKKLKPYDTLYIHSIQRLGRSYDEILEQWHILTRVKKVYMVVLNMPILDTRQDKDVHMRFLSNVILNIQAFAAENDKKNIKVSQAEGIATAKKNGVVFGRPRKKSIQDFMDSYTEMHNDGMSNSAIAERMGISSSTLYRYIKDSRPEQG